MRLLFRILFARFIFYNGPSRSGFVNVCGKHDHEDTARSDHFENIKAERVIGKAEDVLTTQMKPVPIFRYLKEQRMISEDDANRLLKYDSQSIMVKELLQIFIQRISLNQLRLTLIKTEQTQLLRYLTDSEKMKTVVKILEKATKADVCYISRETCYVVANDYNDCFYIHIRKYMTKGS